MDNTEDIEESMSKKDKALFNWGLMDAIWSCDHKNAMEIVKTGIDLNVSYSLLSAIPNVNIITDDEMEIMNYLIDKGAELDVNGLEIIKESCPPAYEYYKSRGVITESC